jgi:hypothetical protein
VAAAVACEDKEEGRGEGKEREGREEGNTFLGFVRPTVAVGYRTDGPGISRIGAALLESLEKRKNEPSSFPPRSSSFPPESQDSKVPPRGEQLNIFFPPHFAALFLILFGL